MSMTNAEEWAWATVNKITGGRKNSSGRRKA
jgi:hypothetical protein